MKEKSFEEIKSKEEKTREKTIEARQDYEWFEHFKEILDPWYFQFKPYQIESRYIDRDKLLPILEKIFPEKKFEKTELDMHKDYNMIWSKEYGIETESLGKDRFEDKIWREQYKAYSKVDPEKIRKIELPALSDIIDFIKNPEKTLDILEKKKEERSRRSELTFLSDGLLRNEGLVMGTGIGYGPEDEGSQYLHNTLGMIFSYGIDKERSKEIYEISEDKEFNEKIRKLQPLKGLSILDIGCGSEGRFVRFLRELGADARGLDIQKPEKDDNIILQGDITEPENLPKEIKDKKFDLVVSTMTFVPEIVRPKEGVPNALRLVKEEGYFISAPGLGVGLDLIPDNLKEKGFTDLRWEHPLDWPHSTERDFNTVVIHKELSESKKE